jgi:hypothetical protein
LILLLFRFNTHQHSAHDGAVLVTVAFLVVAAAGDQGDPVVIFVFVDGADVVRFGPPGDRTYFVGVLHAPGVDVDFAAPQQLAQVNKGARLAVGVVDMAGEGGVAGPGGEGGAVQVADVAAQPGHVPAGGCLGYADDRHAHVLRGDFEQHDCLSVGFGSRLWRECARLPGGKAGVGQPGRSGRCSAEIKIEVCAIYIVISIPAIVPDHRLAVDCRMSLVPRVGGNLELFAC